MTVKQQRAIELVECFIPTGVSSQTLHLFNCQDVVEALDGLDPETAFFLKTDQGRTPKSVTNLTRFVELLWGQRRLAMHEKMYRQGFRDGTLHLDDFTLDPDPVRLFAEHIYETTKRKASREEEKVVSTDAQLPVEQ